MGIHDHWHPLVSSESVNRRPISARIGAQDIALFRTESGQLGALDDMCPHRRMRLSLGRVSGEHLQCKYHGWTFNCEGNGKSPGTPQMDACANSFDVCEKYGFVWVKTKSSSAVLPEFDVEGWCRMCATEHTAEAPLELVLDNFTEIEHTPMIHRLFGFELKRMKEVSVDYRTTEETVTVVAKGPAKRINVVMRQLLGVGRDYSFNDIWTTHFSPVYSVFDHFWSHPTSEKEARVRWRVYVFLVPVEAHRTRIISFTYAKSTWPIPPQGGLLACRGFTRRQVNEEIGRDISLLAGLANHDVSLKGMKLSRFDRALGLNRERIERIYRGTKPHVLDGRLKIALMDGEPYSGQSISKMPVSSEV